MKQGIIKKVLDYYFSPENSSAFGEYITEATSEFVDDEETTLEPDAAGHFTEWFLYDFKLKTGETPLEHFYNENPLQLSDEDLAVYKSMIGENVYDVFEVADLKMGKEMTLERVRTGKSYRVSEKTATKQLRKGDVFICRVINVGDGYEMAGGSVLILPRFTKSAKEFFSKTTDKLTPRAVYGMIRGRQNVTSERVGDDKALITGTFGDAPPEEYDGCPMCQLIKKCKEEGRKPTEAELMQAADKTSNT